MQKKTGFIIIGVCAVLLAGGTIASQSAKNGKTDSTPVSSASDTFSNAQITTSNVVTVDADNVFDSSALLAADKFDTIVDAMTGTAYDTDFTNVIGKTITFTGTPNATDSTADTVVFSSRAPRFNVNAPLSGWASGEITISGTIDDISYMKIDLTDCVIISAAEPETTAATVAVTTSAETTAVVTTTATTPAETTAATTKNSRIVYVSKSGKYHTDPKCSGMKSYTEMSLDDAIAAGYKPCSNCF